MPEVGAVLLPGGIFRQQSLCRPSWWLLPVVVLPEVQGGVAKAHRHPLAYQVSTPWPGRLTSTLRR